MNTVKFILKEIYWEKILSLKETILKKLEISDTVNAKDAAINSNNTAITTDEQITKQK